MSENMYEHHTLFDKDPEFSEGICTNLPEDLLVAVGDTVCTLRLAQQSLRTRGVPGVIQYDEGVA